MSPERNKTTRPIMEPKMRFFAASIPPALPSCAIDISMPEATMTSTEMIPMIDASQRYNAPTNFEIRSVPDVPVMRSPRLQVHIGLPSPMKLELYDVHESVNI